MPKRYLCMSPEFIEDMLECSKDPGGPRRSANNVYKISIGIENDADNSQRYVPIKVHREATTDSLVVKRDVTPEEDAF